MIAGVGLDFEKVGRVARLLRHKGAGRVFGPDELAARGAHPQRLAAAFCAKEAFGKALGTGVRGFRLCEVQLLNGPAGSPRLSLSGGARSLAERRGVRLWVSVSHSAGMACAVVVAERADAKSPISRAEQK